MLRRLIAAAMTYVVLTSAQASQDSYVMPTSGPMSMGTFVATYLNPGLQALASCHFGTSAPANGPSSAPMSGQCWWDTSSPTWSLKFFDGATWVAAGQLNSSSHLFTFSSPMAFSGVVTPAALTSQEDDYQAANGLSSCANSTILRLSSDANRTVTGLSCGQTDNAFRVIYNVGVNEINLPNENASSTAANRFLFSADVNLQPASSIAIIYDGASQRWRPWSRALVNTGVTPGTYGSATQSPQCAFDIQGRATSCANVTITPAIGSVTGLGTGVAAFLATPSSANLAAATTDETGAGPLVFGTAPTITSPNIDGHPTVEGVTSTGATGSGQFVFNTSPTIADLTISGHPTVEGVTATGATGTGKFVFDNAPILITPNLGTPSALNLANANNLPISGISGLATGIGTFLGSPTSGNLAAAIIDETGSGKAVFDTSPILVAPNIGAATATSVNKVQIVEPTNSATLNIADGKTVTDTSAVGANLLLGATGGGFSAYPGASCTNQFARSISAAGGVTCATVQNTDLANSSITVGSTAVPLGGTISAANARGPNGINVESIHGTGDADVTISATTRTEQTLVALTAQRTWTLPSAAAVNPGQPITISDAAAAINGTNILRVQRSGSDTINGSTFVDLSTTYQQVTLVSDGVSKWTYNPASIAGVGVTSFNSRTGTVSPQFGDYLVYVSNLMGAM